MEIVIKILQFILCFSLLVLLHELGHFLFAKLFRIRVEKFYLFFNPWFSLFKFKIGETEYGMGWVPFGGYVSISGMIDETKNADQLASEPQPYEFRSKPAWQRLLVMVGGVLMNILTAIVIYIFMSYSQGSSYIDNKDVRDGYVFTPTALAMGFRDGDRIVSVEGKQYDNYMKIREAIIINTPQYVEVERGGEIVRIPVSEEDVPKLLKDQLFMELRQIAVVDSVVAGYPAEAAGLKKGDSIVAVNGTPIQYFDQAQAIIRESANQYIELGVIRKENDSLALKNLSVAVTAEGTVGITADFAKTIGHYKVTEKDYTFIEAIPRGFELTYNMCASYVNQMKLIFSPKTEAYKSVGSVLTMGSLFPETWDWLRFWNLAALFSIILAVMNLLPIPALDGGHVMFLLFEMITGRKPGDKFLERMQTIGIFLLLGLMALAFWNDISRFFLK